MSPVEKPCIFVASTGRTGTQFFGKMMGLMIDDCTSLHEADTLWLTRPQHWYRKLRQFGVYRMTLGKFNPHHSLQTLGIARQRNEVGESHAIEALERLRGGLFSQTPSAVALEANSAYGPLVDLLPEAFPNCRIVYVIRDPRDWIRSFMNFRTSTYGPLDLRARIPNARLTAQNVPNDPWHGQWGRMTRFERLCWSWRRLNEYSLQCAKKIRGFRVYRFEDLFYGKNRDNTFREMLEFVTQFPNGLCAKWRFDPDILSRKVHSRAAGAFPRWTDWGKEYVSQLHNHCGELMSEFQYGEEPEWKEKLTSLAAAPDEDSLL